MLVSVDVVYGSILTFPLFSQWPATWAGEGNWVSEDTHIRFVASQWRSTSGKKEEWRYPMPAKRGQGDLMWHTIGPWRGILWCVGLLCHIIISQSSTRHMSSSTSLQNTAVYPPCSGSPPHTLTTIQSGWGLAGVIKCYRGTFRFSYTWHKPWGWQTARGIMFKEGADTMGHTKLVSEQLDAEGYLLPCDSADTKRQAPGLLMDSSSQAWLTCLSPPLVSIVRGDLVGLEISAQAKPANRMLLSISLAFTGMASSFSFPI